MSTPATMAILFMTPLGYDRATWKIQNSCYFLVTTQHNVNNIMGQCDS